ncbi:MAG: hypothetical protein KKG92_01990 [Gammaproteobacteria bacterium]|nr:hypothetical protein [Gammaproteobacteria bacterium]
MSDTNPNPQLDSSAGGNPSPPARHSYLPILIAALVGVAATYLLNSGRFQPWMSSPTAPMATRVVVLDSNRIIGAATKKLAATPGLTAEQATYAGLEMGKKLTAAIAEYKAAGAVVINAAVVLASPGDADVTAAVAAKVGVALE